MCSIKAFWHKFLQGNVNCTEIIAWEEYRLCANNSVDLMQMHVVIPILIFSKQTFHIHFSQINTNEKFLLRDKLCPKYSFRRHNLLYRKKGCFKYVH